MRKKRVILLCALMAWMLSIMAQGSSDQRVTIHLERASLGDFLNEVKQQTGLDFIMTSGSERSNTRVTVNETNAPLRTVLNKVLGRAGFNYEIRDGFIALSDKQNGGTKRTIGGRVIDQSGDPLPGAVVSVKGHQIRTVTNSDGRYSLDIPSSDCTLEFSFVGMKQELRTVRKGTGLSALNVAMRNNTELDEVVVTGYQELDRTRIAGAVSILRGEDLDLNGINSLEQAMQGKLAGVAITNESGLVGVKQKTRVRGTSTLLGSQEPIWVVDGVIQETPLPFSSTEFDTQGGITEDNFDYIRNFVGNSISWLNPMDIENITVLKDASATAIYGVRAANGVIVIKTKRGKMGTATVSYSGGVNFGERVSYKALERMNSRERIAVSKEIFERGLIASATNPNSGVGYSSLLNKYLFRQITAEEFEQQVARLETVNTDWFDILYRNPVSHNHSVSFGGGYDKARYYASASYRKTNGTAIGNDSESYGAHVGLNFSFSPKFTVNANVSISYATTNAFYGSISPYSYAINTNRAIPAYQDNGDLAYYIHANGYQYNIINERDNSGNKNKNLSMTSSINAYYSITDDLKFNTLFNLNTSSVNGESWATEYTNYIATKRFYEYGSVLPSSPEYLNSPLPRGGEYNTDNTVQLSWGWRNSLQYDKLFNNIHAITAMIGLEMNSTKYDGKRDTRYGYLPGRGKSFATVPALLTNMYSGDSRANELAEKYYPVITDTKTNTMGVYLTLNYAYDNRYIVNLSVRGDASNRFGQYHNEKFNPVWAGGLRWNVAKEKWFQNQNVISDLSVRASFGFQRNMASNFSSSLILRIPTGSATSIVDQRTGDYLLNIKSVPYDDLRWEKTFSQNYGADFGLFNNKIRMSVEYYYKKGTDIITLLPLPREYGIENLPVNSGSMTNKGYEITAGFTPVRTKNFTWDVNINTAKNWNDVNKVGMQSMNWTTAKSGSFYKSGYAVGSIWAFKFDGIDKETGYPIIDLSTESGADTSDPTSYMVYAGKLDPDFTGGLGMSFRYKQFSLSTSLYLQLGGKKFLTPAFISTTLPSEYENMTSELLNRWTPDNVNAELPGLPDYNITLHNVALPDGKTNVNLYEMYNWSTARVVSASSLRCNNMSLSYTLPNKWVNKTLRMKSLSFGASITNLFSINSKDFKGRDAEVATGQQPRTRSMSINVNAAF